MEATEVAKEAEDVAIEDMVHATVSMAPEVVVSINTHRNKKAPT